ncbi:MAG TPA: hypothetical protein VFD52_08145 [Clostridia bacterium]|nr:hypothetical protein [Clostridia bacterium]
MSLKNLDRKNRWRSKTVAFRVSPEEWEQINTFVKLSGLQKQEYLISRVLKKDIVVQGSPRTYKALRNQLSVVLELLQSLSSAGEISQELLEVILQIAVTLNGMKGELE